MILPFIAPKNGELINLFHVVCVTQELDEKGVVAAVTLDIVGGRTRRFEGKEAEIVNAEIHFAVAAYRSVQQNFQKASEPPLIVPVNGRAN